LPDSARTACDDGHLTFELHLAFSSMITIRRNYA
jgi:hypothetical protein